MITTIQDLDLSRINNMDNGPQSTSYTSISDNEMMLSFARRLEGYKTKIKELHWAAPSHSVHIVLDDFFASLGDFEDKIIEVAQGFLGQIRLGTLIPITCDTNNDIECLIAIQKDITYIRSLIKDRDEYIGIVNGIEDFHETLGQSLYLLRICYRSLV